MLLSIKSRESSNYLESIPLHQALEFKQRTAVGVWGTAIFPDDMANDVCDK
jgi:hypothetical protein